MAPYSRLLIYGSFDPFTSGHEWMCRRALELADQIVIATLTDPNRKYALPHPERVRLARLVMDRYNTISNRVLFSILHKEEEDPILHLIHNKCDGILRCYREGEEQAEQVRRRYHLNRFPSLTYLLEEGPSQISGTEVRTAISEGGWVSKETCHPEVQTYLRRHLRSEIRFGVLAETKADFLDFVQTVWRKFAESERAWHPAIRAVFLTPFDTKVKGFESLEQKLKLSLHVTEWRTGINLVWIRPEWVGVVSESELEALGGWFTVQVGDPRVYPPEWVRTPEEFYSDLERSYSFRSKPEE